MLPMYGRIPENFVVVAYSCSRADNFCIAEGMVPICYKDVVSIENRHKGKSGFFYTH